MTKELGFDAWIDFTTSPDLVKELVEITGGAQEVINVSISPADISQSLQYIRTTGSVVLVGLPSGAEMKLPVFDTVVESVKVVGSFVGNQSDTRDTIDLLVRRLTKSPIKMAGLSELTRIYEEMGAGTVSGRYLVDTSYYTTRLCPR